MYPNGLSLSEIWIYPIKSLGGLRLSSSAVTPKGLLYDRRYMLADMAGNALTQREHPRMALFKTSITDESITVRYLNESISFPAVPNRRADPIRGQVWDDAVELMEPDPKLSAWFSEHLALHCRLLFFPEDAARPVEAKYRINDEHVSLADAYPILIIGEESLNDLNARLTKPVPMDRFRPNFVLKGGTAFIEDSWTDFFIGDNAFKVVKPCARCVLTTVDQGTAEKGKEPLKTLSSYRARNGKVYFGQNVLVVQGSVVREGDAIIDKLKRPH